MALQLSERDLKIWQEYQGGRVKIQAVAEAVGLNRNLVGERIKAIKEQIEMEKAATPTGVPPLSSSPEDSDDSAQARQETAIDKSLTQSSADQTNEEK